MKTVWQTIGDFKVSNIQLGKGQSCQVYYGVNVKTGQKVAAKKISIKQITHRLQKQLQNEITNLTKLKSPFIVRLLGYVRYEKDKQNYLYLFLEYCDDIDLKKYLDIQKKKTAGLCQTQALLFLRHIIQGYKELYQNKIIHRDIKPANILLKQGIAKLSDFGFSRVVDDPQLSEKFTLLGTPLYTAPEILRAQQFSSKCDVWSVGILFYQMLYGKTPWTGTDLNNLRDNILKKPLQFGDINRSQQNKQLIKKMLKIDPKDRISWNEVFEHHIFKQQLPKQNKNSQNLGYEEYKRVFLEYLKNNIVKSYLRTNMNEVKFKQSYEPTQSGKKDVQLIKQISKLITHQRNVAFLYVYMLALYYKNLNIIPKTINSGMQLEYALAKKAFQRIANLGSTYISKQPPNYPPQLWKKFKQSAQYEQLSKIITADYKVVHTLIQIISSEVQKSFKLGKIKPQIVQMIKNIEKVDTFNQILRFNQKQFGKTSKTGVCGLLSYYIDYAINPKEIEETQNLQFGQFYEVKERQYGLA